MATHLSNPKQMKAPELNIRARIWMDDFCVWELVLPYIPGVGSPVQCAFPVMVKGQAFKVHLKRGDYSDGHWNFYEVSRKRMAPAY